MKTVTETPAALSSPGGVNRFRYRNGRIYRTSSTLRLVRHYKRPAHASFIIYYLYSGRVAAFACRQISPANISRQTFYFFLYSGILVFPKLSQSLSERAHTGNTSGMPGCRSADGLNARPVLQRVLSPLNTTWYRSDCRVYALRQLLMV